MNKTSEHRNEAHKNTPSKLFAKFNNFSKIRSPSEILGTLWSSNQATNTQSFHANASKANFQYEFLHSDHLFGPAMCCIVYIWNKWGPGGQSSVSIGYNVRLLLYIK